jgi:hypothetical protein
VDDGPWVEVIVDSEVKVVKANEVEVITVVEVNNETGYEVLLDMWAVSDTLS